MKIKHEGPDYKHNIAYRTPANEPSRIQINFGAIVNFI